jgi:hypothetical protein
MKKRMLAVILIVVVALVCGGRIYYVNATAEKVPPSVYYTKGQEASIGKNIFFAYKEPEIMDGYYVTLTDAKLIPTDTFLKNHGLTKEKAMPEQLKAEQDGTMAVEDYIYEVDVHVTNKSNQLVGKAGIDMLQWNLLATDYTTQCQWELFAAVNPFMKGGTTFSIKVGDSRDFVLPYAVSSENISPDTLRKKNPVVILSQYPVRNLLKLNG